MRPSSARIVRTTVHALFSEGVERHRISGEQIPITCPARTVADCFKHRNQIGLDVCLEALREVLGSKRGIVDEIHHYAMLNRVARVMQPYLEGMSTRNGHRREVRSRRHPEHREQPHEGFLRPPLAQ